MHLSLGRRACLALSSLLAVGLATPVSSAAAAPAASAVRGPDVSGHQHPGGYRIGWANTKSAGASFAFVKATEGRTFVNPYFASDFAALKRVQLVRGAYHFARPAGGAANAVAQARQFVRVAGTMSGSTDLPPVLDLERHDGLKPAALIVWTRAYLQEVARLTGKTPLIYTNPSFWRSRMANTTEFTKYPLWIATWRAAPVLVGGWKSYTFWQYTDRARFAGMAGPVDASVFNGSVADLRAFARDRSSPSSRTYIPSITAGLSAGTVKVGSSVTLKGKATRALVGETLYRQGYWSGSWHTWAKTKVSATGSYAFKIRPTNRATNVYRVHVKSTKAHSAASSETLKLRAR